MLGSPPATRSSRNRLRRTRAGPNPGRSTLGRSRASVRATKSQFRPQTLPRRAGLDRGRVSFNMGTRRYQRRDGVCGDSRGVAAAAAGLSDPWSWRHVVASVARGRPTGGRPCPVPVRRTHLAAVRAGRAAVRARRLPARQGWFAARTSTCRIAPPDGRSTSHHFARSRQRRMDVRNAGPGVSGCARRTGQSRLMASRCDGARAVASVRRRLSENRRPRTGIRTMFSPCRTPMMSRMPPTRWTS